MAGLLLIHLNNNKLIISYLLFWKRQISEIDKQKIKEIIQNIAVESHKTEDNLSLLDMVKHGNLFKTLNLWFAWITVCISYYALSLNAADLGGNIILNYVLKSLVGILVPYPILALSMNKIGRKYSLVSSHTFLGTSLLCLAFIPKEYTIGVLIFYLLSIMASAISMEFTYYSFKKST